MAEILQNPNKLAMLLVMVGLGIAGVVFLVIMWSRDAKPKADTVEVVRCKDCAYWKEYDGEMFCYCWCGLHSDTTEDDYCSYGSRRAEDGK